MMVLCCFSSLFAITHTRYGCIITAKDMVAPLQTGAVFNKADYYANPQNYRPVFHERVAPYTNVLVNGMYVLWRLFFFIIFFFLYLGCMM